MNVQWVSIGHNIWFRTWMPLDIGLVKKQLCKNRRMLCCTLTSRLFSSLISDLRLSLSESSKSRYFPAKCYVLMRSIFWWPSVIIVCDVGWQALHCTNTNWTSETNRAKQITKHQTTTPPRWEYRYNMTVARKLKTLSWTLHSPTHIQSVCQSVNVCNALHCGDGVTSARRLV